jgi:hypothetical protein
LRRWSCSKTFGCRKVHLSQAREKQPRRLVSKSRWSSLLKSKGARAPKPLVPQIDLRSVISIRLRILFTITWGRNTPSLSMILKQTQSWWSRGI